MKTRARWSLAALSRTLGRWHSIPAFFPKFPRLLQRVLVLYRFFGAASGRQRLRFAVYARIPRILWHLGHFHRRTWARYVRVVAVVGSFGKTTTRRAVSVALGLSNPGHGGWNAGGALVENILHIKRGAQHAVIEAGISDRGQMDGHARLIRPDIVVVTSIGSEHRVTLGTLEVTRMEKAKMVRSLPTSGLAVLNGDDPNVLWMRDSTRARVITYGFAESNQVRATDVVDDELSGVRFRLHVEGEAYTVKTRLVGRHMVYPILAAVAVAGSEGREIGQILAALEQLEPTRNRLEPVRHESGAVFLLDAYKATLETIHAALDTLDHLPAARKIVVLGQVPDLDKEPPDSVASIYEELGQRIAEVAVRVISIDERANFDSLTTGAMAGDMSREAQTHVPTGCVAAARALESDLRIGDLVLIKGRTSQHLERVAFVLLGKEVECTIRTCNREWNCVVCPLLQRGI